MATALATKTKAAPAAAKQADAKPKSSPRPRTPVSVRTPVFLGGPAPARNTGQPLTPAVQTAIENSLQVNLDSVRVHTDSGAQQAASALSARAFTYGNEIFLGRGERATNLRLMAHEAAHVVQQQGAPVIQTWSDRSDACEHEAHHAATAVESGQPFTVRERTGKSKVQRLGLSDVLNFFADAANAIPGFRMFTIIIGLNPINMSRVERTAANILRAIVEFIPGGALITQALDRYGVFDRVGTWIEQQISSLGISGSSIRESLNRFLDSLSIWDIGRPGSVWERARRIFSDPIDRIIGFVRGLGAQILTFIRDAILRPLAELASQSRGWDLLCAVLGRNPITGEAVPRTAETLIGGFMRLIGQEEVWENIQRANAIPRAWAWFQGALNGLLGFVRQIPTLFIEALRSLEIEDIVLLPRAFARVGRVFLGFAGQFISWAGQQVWTLLEIIFDVLAPAVMPYLRRAASAFRTILRNPMAFVHTLVRAAIQGFRQFASNFLTHLRASLIQWLTGTLAGANIYIPQGFTFMEIIRFVLSVLGLTWQNIRQKLVLRIGETAVRAMEIGFDLVVTLVTQGPAAAWQRIQEGISNLREMVMEQVMTFVRDRIVQAAITRLVTSLNPAGAFIQAIIAIYNTIMFFVERLRQIAQVAAAFIDSISAIANGVITAAANRVEQTMAGLLTLVISFLARLVGLGRVSDAVVNIVNRIRAPIDRALDRVVEWIINMAQRAGRAIMGTIRGRDERTPEQKQEDLNRAVTALRPQITRLMQRGIPRPLLLARFALWRRQYRLTSLGIENGVIRATINPSADMYTAQEVAIGAALEPILQQAEARFLSEQAAQPTSRARLAAAQGALAAGTTLPRGMTPAEMNITLRGAVAGTTPVTRTGDRATLLSQQGGDPYSLSMNWDPRRPAPRLFVQHTDFPFRRDLAFTQFAYQYQFGSQDRGPDTAHLPGQPFPAQRPTGSRGGDINQWLIQNPGQVHPAIEGLSGTVETARYPGNLAAYQVSQGLTGAGVPLVAGNDPRQGPVLVTPAERIHGLMAGMAMPSSSDAAQTRMTTGAAPRDARELSAEQVRRGSYAVIFQTLREAIRVNAQPILTQPGGDALRDLAQAFGRWLDASLPRGLAQDDAAVRRAAQDLRNSLVAFLRARQPRE